MTEPRTTETLPSVLIADDDAAVRSTLLDYAQMRGYATWEAANGLEALWIVKHRRPHLVLLDLSMPRLGGFDTVRHIQKFDPSIRIVIVTGDPSEDTRRHVEALGLALLLKPFTLDALDVFFVDRPR